MATFSDCYSLSKKIFPKDSLKFRLKRTRYALRLRFLHPGLIEKAESFFAETPTKRYVFALPNFRTLMYKQQLRPWFYRNSTAKYRWHFLTSHFSYLEKTHKSEVIRGMYSSEIPPLIAHEKDQKLSFRIGYHVDASKEGLAWFLLEMNDEVLYKISFWLMEYDGVPTLCIGALQGGKATLETNRIFTKEFFGLRPQNLALTVLRWYAIAAGIQQIFTFPKEKMMSKKINENTAITEFWEEQGAKPVVGTPFISIDLVTRYKSNDDIPTRKRSMYKKRYEFVDRLGNSLSAQFETYIKRDEEKDIQQAA